MTSYIFTEFSFFLSSSSSSVYLLPAENYTAHATLTHHTVTV